MVANCHCYQRCHGKRIEDIVSIMERDGSHLVQNMPAVGNSLHMCGLTCSLHMCGLTCK